MSAKTGSSHSNSDYCSDLTTHNPPRLHHASNDIHGIGKDRQRTHTCHQTLTVPSFVVFAQRSNFAKSHLFDVRNGVRVDLNRESSPVDHESFPVGDQADSLAATGTAEFESSLERQYATTGAGDTGSLPAWVAYDRKVLRFYAYFKEAVFSSPIEHFRVRKCVVYYYLEDDSVHIAEPRVENSGIPQGVFIKRHRIPKNDNTFVNLNDLYIGAELSLYGRVFRLIDCDSFTRQFFSDNGVNLGEPEEIPVDPFTKKNTTEVGTFKKLMHPMKEFMEAALGKQMGVEIAATQKFLKNDGKVLRFYCTWDDDKMYGEIRPYVLHYFLADDTVEVLEVKQANSGRDPFPALLKRSKLPKAYTEISPDVSRIGSNNSAKVSYYTETDINCGDYVDVYGRKLLVCSCDAFTKNYFMQKYGMPAEAFPQLSDLEVDDNANDLKLIPPEYNGFGTEEDSLGSFLYLGAKVPKVDFKKQMECDGLNLRFLAKFVNPAPEDRNRRFIITYFMSNDSISIFEKFERNSGFIGGKFLERNRIKNPATGQYFSTTDLQVGVQVVLNVHTFEIIEADLFTQNYMAANPNLFASPPQAPEESKEEAAEPTVVAKEDEPVSF